jgi:hypothetical protein
MNKSTDDAESQGDALPGYTIRHRVTDMAINPDKLAEMNWWNGILQSIEEDDTGEKKPDTLEIVFEDLQNGFHESKSVPTHFYSWSGGVAYYLGGQLVPLELPSDPCELWGKEQMARLDDVVKRNQQFGIEPPVNFELRVWQRLHELERLQKCELKKAYASSYQTHAEIQNKSLLAIRSVQAVIELLAKQDALSHGYITIQTIKENFLHHGLSDDTIERWLKEMVKRGLIKPKAKKGEPWLICANTKFGDNDKTQGEQVFRYFRDKIDQKDRRHL